MTAITNTATKHNVTTNDAGRSSPHPSEAHQRAAVKGDKKTKYMNGSRLDMQCDGWWIVKVASAAGSFKRSDER